MRTVTVIFAILVGLFLTGLVGIVWYFLGVSDAISSRPVLVFSGVLLAIAIAAFYVAVDEIRYG